MIRNTLIEKICGFIIFIGIIVSCQKKMESTPPSSIIAKNESIMAADAVVVNGEMGGESSVVTYKDEKRQFIKRANAVFETKNVYQTTLAIEQKVSELNGFVVNSNIEKNIQKTDEFELSTDSVQLVRTVMCSNLMIVKIPETKLGVFLNDLEPYVLFLNHRGISADDVTLNFEQQKLDKQRLSKTTDRLDKIVDQKGKVVDKSTVIGQLDDKINQKNQSDIETKRLNDQVNMSEVSLQFNESEKIVTLVTPNTKDIYLKYHTGFWYKIRHSFSTGIYYFTEFLVELASLWLFVLVLIFGGIVWLYLKKK